jgi:molybdopterin/thiamine biosynthesis adenylyltransferase
VRIVASYGKSEIKSKSPILIVGAGGLGAPAALALARANCGPLLLVDPDPVELSNLPRQIIYGETDIGLAKADAAARRLAKIARDLSVETAVARLDERNASRYISRADFVIDATDDPAAKFLINDVCVELGRPFVYGGVLGLSGQAMTVMPGETACLRCLFETPPDIEETASCRDAGIIGPVAGAIGTLQASEAIRAVSSIRPALAGKILTLDGSRAGRVRIAPISARPGCACGAARAQFSAANAAH